MQIKLGTFIPRFPKSKKSLSNLNRLDYVLHALGLQRQKYTKQMIFTQ